MDTQKDAKQKTATKQEKDMSVALPHSDRPAYRYVFKKAERIAAAIHLMTDYVPQTEPLRLRLRETSLSLVTDIAALNDNRSVQQRRSVRDAIGRIDELMGLLEVAQSAQLISDMNARVLMGECGQLADLIVERSSELSSVPYGEVGEHFFTVENTENGAPAGAREGSRWHGNQDSGYESAAPAPAAQKPAPESTSEARASGVERARRARSESAKQRHSKRRQTIIDLARERGRINVRDVAEAITDCSEKTLQRELLALVSEGVLNKEGERRWSVYMLTPEAHKNEVQQGSEDANTRSSAGNDASKAQNQNAT
jgi:hypothetical protein